MTAQEWRGLRILVALELFAALGGGVCGWMLHAAWMD